MRKLIWDSEFWGIDIFQVETHISNEDINLCGPLYLIQSLVNVADLQNISKLESFKFHFKESKIKLVKKKLNRTEIEISGFKNISLQILENNRSSIDNLFLNNTRFDIFPSKQVNDFYYEWLKNSINGDMDDACIGFYSERKLAGFITYRIRGEAISIGLLGVLPDFQGKGISQYLLNYIENLAISKALTSISISTQGKNIKALNAYIKNDFKIHSIDHWYYYQKGIIK